MTAGMIQGTGGKACSSPGPATGALARARKNENWPTLTTVSSFLHFTLFIILILLLDSLVFKQSFFLEIIYCFLLNDSDQ